jgi:hypothetical protein
LNPHSHRCSPFTSSSLSSPQAKICCEYGLDVANASCQILIFSLPNLSFSPVSACVPNVCYSIRLFFSCSIPVLTNSHALFGRSQCSHLHICVPRQVVFYSPSAQFNSKISCMFNVLLPLIPVLL